MPCQLLAPAFDDTAEHEVEEGIERIHLDFEIAFKIAEWIDEDFHHFLLVQRTVTASDRGPGLGIFTFEADVEVAGGPGDGYMGGLPGCSPDSIFSERNGRRSFARQGLRDDRQPQAGRRSMLHGDAPLLLRRLQLEDAHHRADEDEDGDAGEDEDGG